MSVVIADLVLQAGGQPSDALAGHADFALAAITAGLARSLKQIVVRNPLVDEPAHALVAGIKTEGIRRTMAKQCEWVISPPEM